MDFLGYSPDFPSINSSIPRYHCWTWSLAQDKLLREAISNLESEHFCHYLMDHDTKCLAMTYETVSGAVSISSYLKKHREMGG